jgi:hypothetical protein
VKDCCPGGKITATEAMKYYIYISDAKVDMLFPQVPHDIKKKVALEFKMDLKLLSASRKTETETEDNRIARLEAVVDFIHEFGNIGTVDEPDQYVEATLPMHWGCFRVTPPNQPVYFAGETERTVVGLGGSAQHLLGGQGDGEAGSNSLTPALLDFIYKELGSGENQFKGLGDPSYDRGEEVSLRAVVAASKDMRGPSQNLEFLAKRLLFGSARKRGFDRSKSAPTFSSIKALLATPLYVAMAD